MRIDMIGRWLTHLLFPPVCRGCGERWDIFRNEDPGALCDKCFAEWEEAVKGLSFTMPSLLAGSGSRAHLVRVAYQPGKKQLAERLVLRIKDKRDRELFRFFAEDMRLPLWQLIEQHGDVDHACIVFVPRRPEARRAVGHDQAEELAYALARALELNVIPALRHRSGRRVQKQLNTEQREKNAAESYRLTRYAATVCGKTVVLVDDIVTAGSTLAAATALLLQAGAAGVITVTVAATATVRQSNS